MLTSIGSAAYIRSIMPTSEHNDPPTNQSVQLNLKKCPSDSRMKEER